MDRKWWTLIAGCTGTFMLLLDVTVVTVALPAIQRSLHSSFADLQWVIDAYSITLASFLLTAGVVGDMFGRRRLFASGLAIFSASSLACGLSTNPLMLNLMRGVQGVGGAIMFATSLALIAQVFSGKERGTAFGIYGAVLGGAVAVGPLIGGALTSGIGWRWIFLVNVPIGLVTIAITLTKVVDSKDPTRRRVDWIGFITFSASLFMLVFALVEGNSKGWSSPPIVLLLVGAAVLMGVFLIAEWLGSDPMLDLALFRRPAMVGVSLTAFTISGSIFAMFLYLTLYMQDVLGYGPWAAGIRFLPITMLSFIVAPFAGKLTVRVHSRYLMGLGMMLIALGCKLMTHIQPNSNWTVLLPGFIVAGIGVGFTNPVLAAATVSVVPPQRSGMSSGSSNTFRLVGIATGIAVLGAVFLSEIRAYTANALAATPGGRLVLAHGGSRLFASLAGGGIRETAAVIPIAAARNALVNAYTVGFTNTFNHLMTIATVVAFVGAVGALALVRQRDFVPSVSPVVDEQAPAPGSGDQAQAPADSRPAPVPVPDFYESSLPGSLRGPRHRIRSR